MINRNDTSSPTLLDWLWAEVMCVQAMVGSISNNFRQIVLEYRNSNWVLSVSLENKNETDEEEILDIVDEFSIYLGDVKEKLSECAYCKIKAEITIAEIELKDYEANSNARILFRKRED